MFRVLHLGVRRRRKCIPQVEVLEGTEERHAKGQVRGRAVEEVKIMTANKNVQSQNSVIVKSEFKIKFVFTDSREHFCINRRCS